MGDKLDPISELIEIKKMQQQRSLDWVRKETRLWERVDGTVHIFIDPSNKFGLYVKSDGGIYMLTEMEYDKYRKEFDDA